MIIPERLNILGFEWKVVQGKDVCLQGNCYGSCHKETQKIFIDPNIPEQKKEHTLIHEILHALIWQLGLSDRIEKEKCTEEEIVTTISQGLYQVLKYNDLNFSTRKKLD